MALLPLLKNNPEQIYSLGIQQIVAICGNGKLTDRSKCSEELRSFLAQAPSERLFEYIEVCLSEGFDKSGHVLQDLVNELGRRLDYSVTNGLYSGRQNTVGYDGIWAAPNNHSFIVEVKTSDAYRINLDTIASYKTKLIENGTVNLNSSILIVVGRQDTGDLEAQVRGSRHAWDIRLISIDALIRLVGLKETTEDDTVVKIRDTLIPFEYTRVDKIIDIAFTAAKEVGQALEKEVGFSVDEMPEGEQKPSQEITQERTPKEIIAALRQKIIANLSAREGTALIRKSPALYWSTDSVHKIRIACTISKRYPKGGYWYAYHPEWDKFLGEGENGYYVLGCVDRNFAYALPLSWIRKHLPELSVTKRDEVHYWHVILGDDDDGHLAPKVTGNKYSLSDFAIMLRH
jgi:hypothetical protein